MNKKTRSQWQSNIGFLMASVGAAVGLGNIWGFPYRLGQGGGFIFLLLYIFFALIAGFPILLAELSIGRHFRLSPVRAFHSIHPSLSLIGIFNLIACFLILAYYSFFGGLLLNYALASLGIPISMPVFWHLIFISLTAFIVLLGVNKGIEICSLFMIPALILFLIFILSRTIFLPGSHEAFRFLFYPDFSKLSFATAASALTQVFFSMSLGQGCMITFGSYLNNSHKLLKNAVLIPIFDTLVALLAALAIMPAVFSYGFSPASGPALIFDVIPAVFSELPAVSFIFFILVFFAAITSSVSMLETLVASASDSLPRIKRDNAVLIIAALAAICGLPVCFSFYSPLFGINFFQLFEFISQYILILGCSVITSLAVVFLWKPQKALRAALDNKYGSFGRLWIFLLAVVTPLLLASVLISLFVF